MSNYDNYWVLTDVQGPIPSSKGTDDYFKVEMVNVKTKEPLESYIVNNNRNQHKWYDIIEAERWGIYKGIRTKRSKGKVVINADFQPVFVDDPSLTRDECKRFKNTGSI
tara:strand:- start:3 stop:329 length:327 start_codon:yes stop_codon:yes gene_type:complete